jgi:Fe-S-cluster-containing hydrogenase component 2
MKLSISEKKCTACQLCQLACSIQENDILSLKQARIRLFFSPDPGRHKIVVCRQCPTCKCMEACKYGAFRRSETGGVFIDEEECQFCLACVEACPFAAVKVDTRKKLPIVCDLCGGHPRCIEVCRTEAIKISETY